MMHTSAHPHTHPHTAPSHMEWTGTLLHSAEARTAVLDKDGLAVPVLCLDIELDNTLHTHMHVEQPFTTGDYTQAQAAARHLKKGMRVAVQAPAIGLRLVACNTTHIHIIPQPTQEPAAPCQLSL